MTRPTATKNNRRFRLFPILCFILLVVSLLDHRILSEPQVPQTPSSTTTTTTKAVSSNKEDFEEKKKKEKKKKVTDTLDDEEGQPRMQQQSAAALLQDSFETVRQRVTSWKNRLPQHYETAQTKEGMNKHTHDRFFPFEPMATCRDLQEVGRDPKTKQGEFDDDSKMICGMSDDEVFQQEGCIIYSIGGNNEWQFEEDLLKRTKCDIHTFDCTGPPSRFTKKPSHPRSHFHHICLGDQHVPAPPIQKCTDPHMVCGEIMTLAQMQRHLHHTHLELIKMDIEGFEVPLLHSWWRHENNNNNDKENGVVAAYPVQMMMEVHYCTYPALAAGIRQGYSRRYDSWPNTGEVIQTATDFVLLQSMLLDMGYVVVSRQDNPLCNHCTELVLVRIPPSQLFPPRHFLD